MKQKRDSLIGGNPKVLRKINRATVLNMIRERQPIPRIKIAEHTKLNKSTVSAIVASLISEGLVSEEPEKNQNVGRTPLNLRLRVGSHVVGAISIDYPVTRVALADIDSSLREYSEISTATTNPGEFIASTITELTRLREKNNIGTLDGIGVTIAGIVDHTHGRVVYAPRLNWEDYDIGAHLQNLCPDTIIRIENDAKASALAELWFGSQPFSLANFVFLSVGPGIGAGIVLDKQLASGEFSAAGEFGHIILSEGGERCSCGNNGCWEAYASDSATVRRYGNGTHDAHTTRPAGLQEIVDAARHGNQHAIDVLRETGHYLGMGIVNILKAVDPEVVIVGGHIIQSWDAIYPELMSAVTERAFHGTRRHITIVPTTLKVAPPLIGAATLAIKEIFRDFRITVQ